MQTRTTIKNRIHKILDSAGIRLKPVLNDLFGKYGYYLLQGIAEKKDLEIPLSTLPSPRIRRRVDSIREVLQETSLSPLQLHLLKTQLTLFDEIEDTIAYHESLILASLHCSMTTTPSISRSVSRSRASAASLQRPFLPKWEMFGILPRQIVSSPGQAWHRRCISLLTHWSPDGSRNAGQSISGGFWCRLHRQQVEQRIRCSPASSGASPIAGVGIRPFSPLPGRSSAFCGIC